MKNSTGGQRLGDANVSANLQGLCPLTRSEKSAEPWGLASRNCL